VAKSLSDLSASQVYSTYLTLYFSVRARALSSLISPAFCIVWVCNTLTRDQC
jgi:hypothetical protein